MGITSSYSSRRYYASSSYSCLLIYSTVCCITYMIYPSFWGVFRGGQALFYPFGVKINVYGATIGPTFFVLSFFIVFLSFLLVSLFLFFSSYLSSYSSLLIYVYYLENPRKLKEKPHQNLPRLEEVTTAIE